MKESSHQRRTIIQNVRSIKIQWSCCCPIRWQCLHPWGLLFPRLFLLFLSSARHEPWSGRFILWGGVSIAARMKEAVTNPRSPVFHDDSFMRLYDVAESRMWYRPLSFESKHKSFKRGGRLRRERSRTQNQAPAWSSHPAYYYTHGSQEVEVPICDIYIQFDEWFLILDF